VREGSQFVIATHAPILLAYPKSIIYELSTQGIRKVPYEETATYSVTRDFILRREAMLKELLAEGE
jgi:predicted ATPase